MKLVGTWQDGDTWPIARFQLKSDSAIKDSTNIAVELFIRDGDTLLARRPGVMATPKSSGYIDLYFRGTEVDWNGLGNDNIKVYPKIYIPVVRAFTGGKWEITQATNLLLNPGFDTAAGVNPTRIATSWSLIGAQTTEIFDAYANDPVSEVIAAGGIFQLVNPGASGVTALEQAVAVSVVPGDSLTFGCWVRGTGLLAAASDDASIKLTPDGGTDAVLTRIPGGAAGGLGFGFDWKFIVASVRCANSHAATTGRLEYKGQPNSSLRYDEANLFKGYYLVKRLPPYRIHVDNRKTIVKTANQIAGVGGFEHDSNNDGVPDGVKYSSVTNIASSIERDPDHIRTGKGALKLVFTPTTSSGARYVICHRGDHKAGEIWSFSAWVKNTGSVSPSPTLSMQGDPFDGQRTSSSPTSISGSVPGYTKYTTQMTLLSDTSLIECVINVGLITTAQTMWVDDAELVGP